MPFPSRSSDSRFMPCAYCGEALQIVNYVLHICDPERLQAYLFPELQDEVERFDKEWWRFVLSNQGEFEAYYAERQRLRAA